MNETQDGNPGIETICFERPHPLPYGTVRLTIVRHDHRYLESAPYERLGKQCLLQLFAADAVTIVFTREHGKVSQSHETNARFQFTTVHMKTRWTRNF